MKQKLTHLCTLILCAYISVHSISNAYAVDFHSVNDLYHIPIRETNSACKDCNGFVWVSSKMGILRLTNDDCRVYQLPYAKISMTTVKLACRDTMLLAYCSNGEIFKFNHINDQFERYANLAISTNNEEFRIGRLLIDSEMNIWIASATGLYKYENQHIKETDNKEITDCIEWFDDSTLIVNRRNDILIFDAKQTITKQKIKTSNSTKSSLYIDSKRNQIWVGTKSNGLFKYDLNTQIYCEVNGKTMPKQPILALEPLNDSILLAGVDGQGVWAINCETNQISDIFKKDNNNPNSLEGNGVYDILCEPGNRVWICTYSNGVSFFNIESQAIAQTKYQINNINSISDDNVNDIIEDAKGNIWFATNNGISRYTPETDNWLRLFVNEQNQSQVFLSLCEDANGNIWAGTYASGVYVIDKNGNNIAHYSSKTSSKLYDNDFVFDIIKDNEDNIWIGGVNDDVFRYKYKSGQFDRLPYVPLYAFAEFDEHSMLLGCTNGLFLLDKKTGNRTTIIDRNIINDILLSDNVIWVATNGYGLRKINLKNNEIEQFNTKSGLPSDFVTSIVYADGFIWLGTELGLCKFNPKTSQTFVFNSIPELSSASFNQGARCQLKNGNIVFGTNKGAIIFNPTAQLSKQPTGKIYLQDITVAGRSIRQIKQLGTPINNIDKLKLNYTQNTIRVELVPTGEIAGPKFSWKLEGVDNGWNQPTNDRTITYSNIPNKNVTLRIRLYDNTMSSVIDERTLQIVITPPFWHRWWFLVACYLIVGFGIFVIITEYIGKLKRQHAEDKIRFFTNTAHDIRTSLTLIKAPIEELQKEHNLSAQGSHFLDIATSQTKQLSAVVTQLMDFQKTDIGKEILTLTMTELVAFVNNKVQMFESMASSNHLHIKFAHNVAEYQTAIDCNMISKAIDNLISNAIKYSVNGGEILIRLDCDNSIWRFSVTDHGIGISEKAQHHLFKEFYRSENAINTKVIGSGIGLMLVKNYVAMHDGHVGCVSKVNEGSTFSFEIPRKTAEKKQTSEAKPVQTTDKQNNKENILIENNHASEIKLLIVEDNDTLLDFMCSALSPEFDTLTANNGSAAWKIIQEQQPDIVVSDIMMPEMDGFELCKKIKSTYETAHIPLVLLTALSERTEQLHGLGLGADDYLTKPFDMDLLRQRIVSIVKNRNAIRSKIINSISSDSPSTEVLGNKQNDEFIQRLRNVVNENMGNCDFDKEQFAFAMNVSSSLLYKKIKALTDQSPTDFIKTVRLEHAMQLLKTKNYTITEISEMCGFASAGYFSTVFKKQFGFSPSEHSI